MITLHPERRNITPEKAVRILKKHGQKVTLKEARMMLDFMYNFAFLSLTQVLNDANMEALAKENHYRPPQNTPGDKAQQPAPHNEHPATPPRTENNPKHQL